jgi:RND superfamily putative drug exporter
VLDQNTSPGFTSQLAGNATLNADTTKVAQDDLKKGESVGITVALIVLVIVFASILAAVLPISMAMVAIVVALGLVWLIGQFVHFNLFVENMITMIGLAVGIDYSLFIVSRYREERGKGFAKLDAIAASGATANRAVFFSGMTVVLALLGMLIVPVTIFRALSGGAILVTIAALGASMTLLPALLSLLGDRTDWPWMSRVSNVVVLVAMFASATIVGAAVGALGAPTIAAVLAGLATLIVFAVVLTKVVRRGSWSFVARRTHTEPRGHDPRGGFWDLLTRRVMGQPWLFLTVSVLILVFLGSFYFQLNRGSSTGVSQLPDKVPSKQAFLILARDFAGGLSEPAKVVITGDVNGSAVQPAIQQLQPAIGQDPTFAPNTTVTPSKDGTAIEVDAYFRGDPSTDAAFQGIRDLRSTIVPAAFAGVPNVTVLVGGDTAFFTDFLYDTDSYQWIVLGFVLSLSFLLLMVVFRSLVLPIKAIIMNLLSVGAAYGAITLVFQKGVGIGIFNLIGFSFQRSEAIEAWIPLFLFSVLFGLSMDYHVFLLSRIREEYDKTHDNTEAVAYGLRTTAGIITGAAIIMVVVFTSFASGSLGPLQQMGFGLAVAVFLDATIVRTLLVPASMRLLGDLNWYLPKWLQWLPELNVEGHEPERVVLPEAVPVFVEADD